MKTILTDNELEMVEGKVVETIEWLEEIDSGEGEEGSERK